MKNGLKITSLSCKRRKYVHFTNRNFIFISKSRVSVCEFGETNLFQSSFDYLDDTYTETVFGYFTFFYINRRKHWFRQNFRFPVFDGFIRFGISWSRFDYFWKMSVCLCVCDKNFVASVPQELMHRISWNFIFWVILP